MTWTPGLKRPEPMNNTTQNKSRGSGRGFGMPDKEGEGVERGRETKVMYQNVGRREDAAHLLLQSAVELGVVVVVMAEPWGAKNKRKQQPGYEIPYDGEDIVVYRIRGSDMSVRGEGQWVMIGGNTAATYLRPRLNKHTVKAKLREMIRKGATTVVGDLNCHGHGKDRMLEEWIEEEEMMDIGTAEYTHRQGPTHKCTIDRILTKGGTRPWKLEQE